ETEVFRVRGLEAALGEELPGRRGAGARELLGEELRCGRVRLEQAAARADVDAGAGAAALLVAQRDVVAAREVLDGLGEREPVDLLHEGDDVATLAATEAVPQPE